MDETTYINLIAAQLRATTISAAGVLGREHAVVNALGVALAAIENGTVEQPHVPAGFEDRTEFEGFVAEQLGDVLAEKNAEIREHNANLEEGEEPVAEATAADLADQVADVVGVIPAEDGGVREVGDLDGAIAIANDIIEQAETRYIEDEDGNVEAVRERIETDNAITITYTRTDNNELTEAQVHTILAHRISEPLKHLGNIQLVSVNDGDAANSKQAVFAILEDGKIDLRGLALGAVAYRGVHVFPGIGRVQAVGSVNFA